LLGNFVGLQRRREVGLERPLAEGEELGSNGLCFCEPESLPRERSRIPTASLNALQNKAPVLFRLTAISP
jgi:hypothetical protein